MIPFTIAKFAAFSLEKKHKKALEWLKISFEKNSSNLFSHYLEISGWLNLPEISLEHEIVSERFHYHLKQSHIGLSEHNFLTNQVDTPSTVPYLPITIYLDNLRSAANIGNIVRTTEAFRLGSLYFTPNMAQIDHPKVISTSMGCSSSVPTTTKLHNPLIALETSDDAKDIFSFKFPKKFTLILGNEEYGISKGLLDQADEIISIPLVGSKNSLNVSNAFSIAAGLIRSQN